MSGDLAPNLRSALGAEHEVARSKTRSGADRDGGDRSLYSSGSRTPRLLWRRSGQPVWVRAGAMIPLELIGLW